jgi:hypothetical protein
MRRLGWRVRERPAGDAIVDRGPEIARLHALLARGTPQLVLVYGRRRVGKTFLLSGAWPGVLSFYFTASETTAAQNRAALLAAYAQWSGEDVRAEDHPTWRAVFRLLLEHAAPQPLVITLDEFQYLGDGARELRAVASELNAAWETRRPPRPLVFVVAGSAVRTLESLNDGGSPLYGRFSWQCRLRPFDYWFAGQLSGFAAHADRARGYAVFGGTPRYLAAVDPRASFEANVVSLMLDPAGEVRELVRTALFQEQGLRDIPKYAAILRAIGRGRTELNAIAQGSGLEPSLALREKLQRLIDLDYVDAGRNLGARPKDAYRYRVSDPAMRFFYDVVAPHESALASQAPARVWRDLIRPTFDTYMGHLFESIAQQAYYRLQPSLDLPLVREWGRWEGLDRARRPLEVDLAALLADGSVLTGAVKWTRRPLDLRVHLDHLAALQRLAEAGVAWAKDAVKPDSALLYVSSSGFSERFRQAALAARGRVWLWGLEEVYGG